MKTKFWNYIRASNGAPIEGAKIDVLAYPLEGGQAVHANIYLAIDDNPANRTTTSITTLLTNLDGYFEFFVADLEETATYGYDFENLFKITWSKPAITNGTIDNIQLFDVTNRPNPNTPTTDEQASHLGLLRNKMVSDWQCFNWEDHIDNDLRDDHSQYLRTDGTRELTGDWDIGAGARIQADQISARDAGILTLSDDSGRGIFIQPGGRVDILLVNVDGGAIDGTIIGASVPAAGNFSTVDINGGTIDGTVIGASVQAAGNFSVVDINGGFIDATVIGASTPAAGNFSTVDINAGTIDGTTIGGNAAAVGTFTTLNATTGNITTINGGLLTVDTVRIDGNSIFATGNAGLSFLDDAGNGIYLNDGGHVTIGALGTDHRMLTIIDTSPQLRLQYSESQYFEFQATSTGGLILTGTGTSPKIYSQHILDMGTKAINSIGTGNSSFSAGGDLTVVGFISATTNFRISNNPILAAPGTENTFLGIGAGSSNASSTYNTLLGNNAGYKISTGARNELIGASAGYNTDSGSDNVILGYQAGYTFTSAGYNIMIGSYAGYSNTASNNVCIGHQVGYNSTAGSNVYIGHQAGYNNITGSGNVFIGYHAGYDTTDSSCLYIANKSDLFPLIFGDFSVGYIGLQTIHPQYTLDMHGHIRLADNFNLYFGGGTETMGPSGLEVAPPSGAFSYDINNEEFILSHSVVVSGGLYAADDGGGKSGTVGISNVFNSSVSTGVGSVKLCGGTSRNSTGFIKIYVNGNTRYVPYFTDITG